MRANLPMPSLIVIFFFFVLSRIISKSPDLSLVYLELQKLDRLDLIPETPIRALERFSKCINRVRYQIDHLAKYGTVSRSESLSKIPTRIDYLDTQ